MLKNYFTEDQPIAEINIVPYVDVMLVLLVIFMITAPLLTSGVQVDLPQTGAVALEQQPEQPMVVTVDNVGNYFLNISETPTTPMMPKDLSAHVAQALANDPNRQVLMRGDENVSYGQVVTAMSMLQQAGAPSVGLITSPFEDED